MVTVPQEAIDKLIAFGASKGLIEFNIEQSKTGSIYLWVYDPRVTRNGTAFYNTHNQKSNYLKEIVLVDLGLLIKFRFADHLPATTVRYVNYIIIENGQVLIYKGRNLLPL